MVKLTTLFFVLLTAMSFGQDVVVTAQIDEKGVVGMPLPGTITITRQQDQKVDLESFSLGGKSLEVEFLKEVPMASGSDLVISIYRFELEPQVQGINVLPDITVNVGGKVWRSISSTYQVDDQVQKKSQRSEIFLDLENMVPEEKRLYPGQRITVGYRYRYSYPLEFSSGDVPLLEASGFKKIGGRGSNRYKKEGLIVYEETQVIEADEPGVYSFGPGKFLGRAYRQTPYGKRDYAVNDTYAESKPVKIEVIPFPKEAQPTSFNGAFGDSLTFEMNLLSSNEVTVGDQLELLMRIKGKGELASMPMPEICCQPGFSGFFRVSDMPPEEELIGSTKSFKVKLRPLNDKIKEIPSLEFSFFNPDDETYTTLKSDPIPITVNPAPKRADEEISVPDIKEDKSVEPPKTPPIEIAGIFDLKSADLKNKPFGDWWTLLLIPFGLFVLWAEVRLKRKIKQDQSREIIPSSQEIFNLALSKKSFSKLKEAFLLKLKEKGKIDTLDTPVEKLPEGPEKTFLQELELLRFAGKGAEFNDKLKRQAKKVFKA